MPTGISRVFIYINTIIQAKTVFSIHTIFKSSRRALCSRVLHHANSLKRQVASAPSIARQERSILEKRRAGSLRSRFALSAEEVFTPATGHQSNTRTTGATADPQATDIPSVPASPNISFKYILVTLAIIEIVSLERRCGHGQCKCQCRSG